jgi:hypothetical protein
MTKHHIETAIELLERIADHDHQGAATRVLLNAPSNKDERLAAYENTLRKMACTDIQGWAQLALLNLHLRGEDADD